MTRALVGLGARLVLAGVLLYAGWSKATDLTGSVQTVVAYEVFSYEVARAVAVLLPVVEIALGLLLLVGLLTRATAAVTCTVLLAFIAGIISAWARGLSIDCGCFGNGGQVDPGQTRYLSVLLRDAGFVVLAGWLVARPESTFSLDRLLKKGS